jgi:hypothetical protein
MPVNILIALIAVAPPLLTLLLTQLRNPHSAPRRAQALDEAQKLVDFTKNWTEAAAILNMEISDSMRNKLSEILLSSAENVRRATQDLKIEVRVQELASASWPLVPWPNRLRARGFAMLYYYTLVLGPLGLGAVIQKYFEDGNIRLLSRFNILYGGTALLMIFLAPFFRRKSIRMGLAR